jgi:hypothetical protein
MKDVIVLFVPWMLVTVFISGQLIRNSLLLTLVFFYYLFIHLLRAHTSYTLSGLPDAASMEAASWVKPDNARTILIDASTAFRTDDTWTYGFPGMFMFGL